MKRTPFYLGGIVFLAVTLIFGQEEAEKPHIYAGVKRCQVCHETTDMGDQYSVWAASKHAKAYETLTTDEANKIAQEWGLKTPAKDAPECLTCHVTGYNDSTAQFGTKFDKTQGIQCESCHGAGDSYRKQDIMCDRDLAIAKGLILPKPEFCLTCHNEKSPRYKEFDYDKFYAQIEHHKNPDYQCESDESEDEEW